MRAGVIDIGSNSIKLMIGEETGPNVTILESLKNIIPIGRSTFFKGAISQDMINQIVAVLEKYKKVLTEYDVSQARVIATTAVREAKNREIFLDTIARKTGLKVEVLNVGDVVYYIDTFLSYKLKDIYPIHSKNLLIAELGAGTLDVAVMRKGFTLMNVGLSIGTLRLKQLMSKLDGSSDETAEAVIEYLENEFVYLKRTIPKIQIDDIILIDENYFFIENILPQKKEKQPSGFFEFTQEDSKELLSILSGKTIEEIVRNYKIPLDIADTIIVYAIILNMFFTLTEKKSLFILSTSLPEAILANQIFKLESSERYSKMNQLVAVANSLCHRFELDINHAKQVANLSRILFEKLADYMALNPDDKLYLILAAYLHDIGQFIFNRSHHKHTEYVVSSLDLFRLTEEEIKIIACIGRYHRRSNPLKTHMLYSSLPTEKQILVQKLSAILKIANALDRSHKQKVKEIEVNFTKGQDLNLIVHTNHNFILEKADFLDKKDLFEEITGNKVNLSVKGT